MGIDKVFIVGGRSFTRDLQKVSVLFVLQLYFIGDYKNEIQ
jgi:hypothetical protein